MHGRPEDSEYVPFAKGYVDNVEGTDLVQMLTSQRDDLLDLTTPLDGLYRYQPGKWTINEVIGHINDAERIFAYRLLCVARGDQTPFPGFEQDDYMAGANFNDRALPDLLDEFRLIRDSSISLVRNLPPDAWLKRGSVAGFSVTPRGIAFTLAGHERHHYRILRNLYC